MSRNFKIFRFWRAYYAGVIQAMYRDDPGLAEAPYQAQMAAFFATRSSYSDSFSAAMTPLGHEVIEVVSDLEPAQKAWARENGVPYDTRSWERDILLAQIAHMKPDIVYLHSLVSTPPGIAAEIRANLPGTASVVAYGATRTPVENARGVDLLIVGLPNMVALFREAGVETHLVYHGFDTNILDQLEPGAGAPDLGFTFIGSSGFGHSANFVTRYWTLVELMIKTELTAWVNDSLDDMPHVRDTDFSAPDAMLPMLFKRFRDGGPLDDLKATIAKMVSSTPMEPKAVGEYSGMVIPKGMDADMLFHLPMIPLGFLMPERCRAPVFGLAMFDLLRRSDLTFNAHADVNAGESANMRLFEATGVGTCLLTDHGSNIADLFELDAEIVTYGSPGECIEKAEYLLAHGEERKAIAVAGRKRTLETHTTAHRCAEIDALLQQMR